MGDSPCIHETKEKNIHFGMPQGSGNYTVRGRGETAREEAKLPDFIS